MCPLRASLTWQMAGPYANRGEKEPLKTRDNVEAGATTTKALIAIAVAAVVAAAYVWLVQTWNYSTGERAGWIQKFSQKGWICKTWEGEMAMVTMPGTAQEKFPFTVRSDDVAAQINKVMGKRVSLHYEEKVGLPTTCFGETRHYVDRVIAVEDIPLAPGIVVPTTPQSPAPSPPSGAPAK
jgi:hypothetical protein